MLILKVYYLFNGPGNGAKIFKGGVMAKVIVKRKAFKNVFQDRKLLVEKHLAGVVCFQFWGEEQGLYPTSVAISKVEVKKLISFLEVSL